MKSLSPFVLMLAAGIAEAAPVPTAPIVPVPAASQAPAPRRFPGVSDEGNAILAKAQAAPDPQQQAINRQLKAAHEQLMAAVMAPVIDADKVAAAMRVEEAAQGQARTHSNDRLIAVLKQLPDDDKGNFLRTLILSRQSRPAAASPAPASVPQP